MTFARLPLLATPIFLALAVPLAAQSACPTLADRATGISVSFEDGSTEVFRPGNDPAVTIVDGVDTDGFAYRMELIHGTHLLVYENVVDGRPDPASRVSYDYGMAPSAMPVPVPGGRWKADVTATAVDGPRPEAQVQAYDVAVSVDIGGCTYDRIEVLIAYDTTDFYTESVHYLPALDIGFLVWSETVDSPRVSVLPVAIARAK